MKTCNPLFIGMVIWKTKIKRYIILICLHTRLRSKQNFETVTKTCTKFSLVSFYILSYADPWKQYVTFKTHSTYKTITMQHLNKYIMFVVKYSAGL